MEKAREEFVTFLVRYREMKNHDITVVFDGHKSGSSGENASVRGGVRVIYSRLGERADDVIKRMISKERKEWIVVTSDRDIANHAWAVNSIPVPSEKFLDVITDVINKDASDESDYEPGPGFKDEDDEYVRANKGSSCQPSKKEKMIRKAFGKL